MRKIILILSFAALSLAAGAQTMSDALTFGNSNYYGTARSMALGNALTAVGGDLGSIGLNPAGSAVNSYSQFSFSPGLTISTSNSAYSQSNYLTYGDRLYRPEADNFTASSSDRYTKAALPNIGMTLNFETGQKHGVKSFALGFLSNNTDSYVSRTVGSGINDNTSIMGYFANVAQYNADGRGNAMDYMVFNNFDNPYLYFNREALAAYDSYMIGPDGRNGYAGISQDITGGRGPEHYANAGQIRQTAIVQRYGTKHDFILNLAANYEDKLYFGFNLGMPIFNYSHGEYFNETALDPEEFPVLIEDEDGKQGTYFFNKANYGYEYAASGEGVYAKIGAIWLPNNHLRLGAAIQTPTLYTIEEEWTISTNTLMSDGVGSPYAHSASDVPAWDNRYTFTSPWIFDFGAALTIGERCLVSVDYELADYGSMRFRDYSDDFLASEDIFYEVNKLTDIFCGTSSTFRLGIEYRLTPNFSVRYGYNRVSNPERIYEDSDGTIVDAGYYDANYDYFEAGGAQLVRSCSLADRIRSNAFGFGYSSNGSFFADFALRFTRYPQSYYSPYGEYLDSGERTLVASPLVETARKVCDAVVTFGWRF